MTTDHAHTIAGMKLAAAAAAAAFTGGMVLIGWAFDIAALKSILPGWFPMKANFAVALILLGIALFLITRPPATFNPQRAVLFSRLARFCVLLAGLIGLLTLCEYMFGWNLGIDQWLFREPAGAVGTSHPGRMAQEAALSLVLLAIALWISGGSRKTRWTVLASGSLGLLVATFGLVAILSHLTPGLGAYGWFGFSITAMHAATMLVILGVAVIAISWQPDVLPWSLGGRTTAAFACGMVVLVFIGFNTSRSQFLMKETNRQIAYIEEVMDNALYLLIEVINTKAQARSYFITGDEQFKTHYLEAQANSIVKLEALRKLAAGHPQQQRQFARIEASANAASQWLQQFIDAKRTGMSDAARNKMVVHGEELLDNFRSTFKQIENEHQQFVEQLKQDSERASRLSSLTIAFGTFASLLIFMITIFRLNFAANESKRKEDEYRTIIYTSLDGFCIADLSGRILDVNEAYCQMLGYTREEFLRLQVRDFEASESPEETAAHFQKFISTGSDRFQTRQRRKDGAILDVEASVQYVAALGERIFSFIRDITERELAEAKIQRLNQLYNLLSQCNQAVVHCANQEELFRHICRDAVQLGGFKMAWVGLVGEVSQRVVPVASYGEGVEYLDGLQISVDADSPFGRGPTGASIRDNQPFWCQDFLNDPLTAPWHESGARFGWGSSASLPLHRKGVAIGAFTLYSGAVNAFDEDVRNLLVEMAIDISYALNNFAYEATRKAAELQLLEHEMQYRTLADSGQSLIWASGTDKLRNYFNQPWLKFTGRTLEQELSNGWAEGVHPDDLAQCLATYVAAFDRRELFNMAYRLRRHDGEYRWIQCDGCPRYNTEGEFVGYIGYCLDITERKKAELELVEQIEELRRWHEATLGREMRVLELKHEVNELLGQIGQPPRYPSAEQSNEE